MKSIIILFLAFVVFDLSISSECTGPNCEQIISMPLLDNMEATLKADLDVRKLNSFIRQIVKKEVEDVMREDIKKIMNESVSNVENLLKDRTNEMKLGLDSKFLELQKKIMNESMANFQNVSNRTNEMDLGLDSKFDELQKKIMNESMSNIENLSHRTNEMKLGLDSKFDKLMKENEMQDEENKVALTAQLTSGKAPYKILKFDNVIYSVGYNNLPAYKSTGKFICERIGLYLVSASIVSGANNGQYYLYLNNDAISHTYISYNSNSPHGTQHTGTIVIALQLHPNDSVWVRNGDGTSVYNDNYSTLTIVKVK